MAKGALHVLLVIKVETQCSRNVLVNKWFSIKVSVGEGGGGGEGIRGLMLENRGPPRHF